ASIAHFGDAVADTTVRAHLSLAFDGSGQRSAGGEHRLVTGQLPHVEVRGVPDVHGAAVGVDARDVSRPPIGSRPGDAEPLTLADREAVHTLVLGEHRSAGI